MPRPVFVSHAYADRPIVEEFVDVVLRNGCGLVPDEIFYSSGDDTGIPSGSNLLAEVQREVEKATLVIAIISPTFVTRPVCMAELGAAWGITGKFLPVLIPGLERSELEGVLGSVMIKYLDDKSTLNEIKDRVDEAIGGPRSKAKTWGSQSEKWLAKVSGLTQDVATPEVVSVEQFKSLQEDLANARVALTETETDREELFRRFEALAAATTHEERLDAILPVEPREQFDFLTKAVKAAINPLNWLVIDVIRQDIFSERVFPMPNHYDDADSYDTAQSMIDEGFLTSDNGWLEPNYEFPKLDAARDTIQRLQEFLRSSTEVDGFEDWFKTEYDGPPNLSSKSVWRALFG